MTDTNAPERIYLQDGGDYSGVQGCGHEVTWCVDSIEDGDTAYIRLDLYTAALARIAALEGAAEADRAALEGYWTLWQKAQAKVAALDQAMAALRAQAAEIARIAAERDSFRAVVVGAGYGSVETIALNTVEQSTALGAAVAEITKNIIAERNSLATEIARLSSPAGAAGILLADQPALRRMADVAEDINEARASFNRIIAEALRAIAGGEA